MSKNLANRNLFRTYSIENFAPLNDRFEVFSCVAIPYGSADEYSDRYGHDGIGYGFGDVIGTHPARPALPMR